MKANIRYVIRSLPHPYNKKLRKDGMIAMCLVKEVVTESGNVSSSDPVALFNYDSEAELLAEHILAEGLEQNLIQLDEPLLTKTKTHMRLRRGARRARYDPNYGNDILCTCGDPYVRHFDPCEDYAPVGCKYQGTCGCTGFTPQKE